MSAEPGPPPVTQPKPKKLKPARKQVKPGDVEKKETPQTGKDYSTFTGFEFRTSVHGFARHLVQQMGWR
jgi:hypothetical protein